MDERPAEIRVFEGVMIAALFAGAIQTGLIWDNVAIATEGLVSPAVLLAMQVMIFVTTLVLTFLVSRMRAAFALYIFLILGLLAAPGFIGVLLKKPEGALDVVQAVNVALQMIGAGLLLLPASRRWVKSR